MIVHYLRDESGAMVVEYGLIVAIIAVSVIGGSMMIGSSIDDNLNLVATTISPS